MDDFFNFNQFGADGWQISKTIFLIRPVLSRDIGYNVNLWGNSYQSWKKGLLLQPTVSDRY